MTLIATERVKRRIVAPPERTNVSRFLAWVQNADPDSPANAATLLARAYLRSNLADQLRRSAKAALIAMYVNLLAAAEAYLATMIEETSTLVRRTFAGALVGRRHIICAPASDQLGIAAVVLTRSPVLSDVHLAEAKGRARHAAERAMKLIATERGMRQMVAPPERSNVCRFLAWAEKADPGERAKAVTALAQAYLRGNLPDHLRRGAKAGHTATLDDLRRDAEVCLTTMVEDASTLVRRTLAEALAGAQDAPRHIICALADDRPEIAAIVLARSPVLNDAELIEYATIGGESVQMAVAGRSSLNAGVATSLAEIDRREVVMALIENPDAHLTPDVMRRIAERFGDEGEVRDALLARSGLPATLRFDLIKSATRALPHFTASALGEKRVERMMRDVSEQVAILVANSCTSREIRDLMRHLRLIGVLTAALLMRALISGGRGFFEAAAVELTNVSPERIAGFTRDPFGAGFVALYHRMGLPQQFLMPFRVALVALKELGGEGANLGILPIVSRVIASCESEKSPGSSALLCLLHRLEAEATVEEVRAFVEKAAAQRAAALLAEKSAFAAPLVATEPEVAVPAFAAMREILDASLAA